MGLGFRQALVPSSSPHSTTCTFAQKGGGEEDTKKTLYTHTHTHGTPPTDAGPRHDALLLVILLGVLLLLLLLLGRVLCCI